MNASDYFEYCLDFFSKTSSLEGRDLIHAAYGLANAIIEYNHDLEEEFSYNRIGPGALSFDFLESKGFKLPPIDDIVSIGESYSDALASFSISEKLK